MDLEPDVGTGGGVQRRLQPLDVRRLLNRMDEALIPQPHGTGRFGHRLPQATNDATLLHQELGARNISPLSYVPVDPPIPDPIERSGARASRACSQCVTKVTHRVSSHTYNRLPVASRVERSHGPFIRKKSVAARECSSRAGNIVDCAGGLRTGRARLRYSLLVRELVRRCGR
jgi:hypothetical protein